jgi:hypothetical protein
MKPMKGGDLKLVASKIGISPGEDQVFWKYQ